MASRIPLPSDELIALGLPDTTGLAPDLDALRRAAPTAPVTELIDPVTAEMVRLRNAAHQGCNLCRGLRYEAALNGGATEELLSAVLSDERDGFTEFQQAALAVADAFLGDPASLDEAAAAELLDHLDAGQVVEVVALVANWSYNKVLISMGFDLDEIRPQVY